MKRVSGSFSAFPKFADAFQESCYQIISFKWRNGFHELHTVNVFSPLFVQNGITVL
jgi:hypothetical protein